MAQGVIFTTTALASTPPWKQVRRDLTLRMVAAAAQHGIKVVILDARSARSDIEEMRSHGAYVFDQGDACHDPSDCMGVARRKALSHALEVSAEDDVLIWMEPEKLPLIRHLPSALTEMARQGVDMLMLNRVSLQSYPEEQACAYKLVELAVSAALQKRLDFMFGPLLFRRNIAHFWLNYGGDYEDKWDSLHIPKLRAIRANVRHASFAIDYEHPSEQSEIERGKMEFLLKRLDQSQLLIAAVMAELKIAHI